MTEITNEEKRNTDYEKCKKCQGSCCQFNACDCSPEDFNNDIQTMEEALRSNKYSIDFARNNADAFIYHHEGYLTLNVNHILRAPQEALYIRPRNIGRPIVDIIHGREDEAEGPCVFWTLEKGCELSYEKRPKLGRETIPIIPKIYCPSLYSREQLIMDWKPYTRELFKLAKNFFSEDWDLYKEFNFKLQKNIG